MKASLTLLKDFFKDCDQRDWGCSEQQIAEAETRLSVSFPKVLRQYYGMFGNCPYIIAEGDNIPVPLELEDFFIPDDSYNAPYVPNELDFLVFFSVSNVSAIDYGIRLSDLALDDPPVYYCDYCETDWKLQNKSLLNFLITAAFWQIGQERRLAYSLNVDDSYYNYDCNAPALPTVSCYASSLGMEDFELEELTEICHYNRMFVKDGVLLACATDEWSVSGEPAWDWYFWLTVTSTKEEPLLEIQKIPGLVWYETK